MALPEGVKRAEHALITTVGDDLDPGVMGGHVDLRERVKAHTAVQMARPNKVGLDHVPRTLGRWRRVWQPLGGPPAAHAARPCHAGARQDLLDRAHRRYRPTELL